MHASRLFALIALAFAASLGTATSWGADTYKIDPVHSSFLFKIRHFNVSNLYGRINNGTGTLEIDEADPAKSTVEIELKPENVDTNNEKRDQHLKGPDFFNAKQFPTLTFKSKSVKKSDSTYEVTGDFTMLGVSKEIVVNLTQIGAGKDPMGGTRAGFEGTFTIKRTDFGMKGLVGPVGDDVTIIASVEAVKNK